MFYAAKVGIIWRKTKKRVVLRLTRVRLGFRLGYVLKKASQMK
jgi:hypothetical protein